MKKVISVMLVGVLALGLIGCAGDNVKENTEEKSKTALALIEGGGFKEIGQYTTKGKLIEIKLDSDLDLEDSGKSNIKVQSSMGEYPGTIVNGSLLYVGEKPEGQGSIIEIIEEIEETIEITKEEFEEVNGQYKYDIEGSENIREINIQKNVGTEETENIPVTVSEEMKFFVEIPNTQINAKDILTMQIKKGISKYKPGEDRK